MKRHLSRKTKLQEASVVSACVNFSVKLIQSMASAKWHVVSEMSNRSEHKNVNNNWAQPRISSGNWMWRIHLWPPLVLQYLSRSNARAQRIPLLAPSWEQSIPTRHNCTESAIPLRPSTSKQCAKWIGFHTNEIMSARISWYTWIVDGGSKQKHIVLTLSLKTSHGRTMQFKRNAILRWNYRWISTNGKSGHSAAIASCNCEKRVCECMYDSRMGLEPVLWSGRPMASLRLFQL
jgi:hypothetical protein